MSLFNGTRLTNQTFKLDIERMRTGWYSDKYFGNVEMLLQALHEQRYTYDARSTREIQLEEPIIQVGDLQVEMQFFTRRKPFAVIVGVDKALAMLRHCTGYFEGETFVETWDQLEVQAVHDGAITPYDGDPMNVKPVIRVRGRYRDFANLETPMIGILSRASRIATNVYDVLKAARGKPVLFFPARFDLHEVQAADGYAYDIAVQRFNRDYGQTVRPFISTDAQGDWWGAVGGGTVPHSIIACFLGDTTAAMRAFARTQPLEIPRIALVDFHNDCTRTSTEVATAFWEEYRAAYERQDETGMRRWTLFGVRLDTSGSMIDYGIEPLGDPDLDMGVTPRLVTQVRRALDNLWTSWGVSGEWEERARHYCRSIKIVVSGGFDHERIKLFEQLRIPVDIYGVGSSLMSNDKRTNTDFTADVVRVKLDGQWVDMAKVGRRACDNPDLEPVDLAGL
jgi:nicotinate phosphoribosyltransferase